MAVRSLFPILATPDLPRLVAFYQATFDGVVDYRFPGEDGADAYVSLSFGSGASIGIAHDPAADQPAPADRTAVWFYVDDVDEAYRAALAAGGSSRAEPTGMPWGERVAQVRDVDGNLVHLGAEPT
ncbi:VOC family protein [Serinicoccus kebangsaanensis]|uniref:VOC family protein n=1 Tax=Serinicoccus kebangsaanensis TaxID=2602069 RepID=UPI00124D0391|nr:VOC family protein [Serinicoccus kebangsaanensis]